MMILKNKLKMSIMIRSFLNKVNLCVQNAFQEFYGVCIILEE